MRLRSSHTDLLDVLDRPDADGAATPVHMRIQDGDRTALDAPTPWARAAEIHARVHLPSHTEQLRALRRAG